MEVVHSACAQLISYGRKKQSVVYNVVNAYIQGKFEYPGDSRHCANTAGLEDVDIFQSFAILASNTILLQ